ncbi:MAG: YbaB/EbfC family nucleoid-associated protein [Bacilli bacterium]|nr:YbaB/EbfC family nucleoid-associated protein [Bacilli bacterium]
MNPMQQMLMEANRINRELAKARAELAKKEFAITKAGLLTLTMLGNRSVKAIKFEKGVLEEDNQDLIEETVVLAVNDALSQIEKANGDINERITGRREGV